MCVRTMIDKKIKLPYKYTNNYSSRKRREIYVVQMIGSRLKSHFVLLFGFLLEQAFRCTRSGRVWVTLNNTGTLLPPVFTTCKAALKRPLLLYYIGKLDFVCKHWEFCRHRVHIADLDIVDWNRD